MNRIILIGNGFDLAHGLKTSYKDFIDDFWDKKTKLFREAYTGRKLAIHSHVSRSSNQYQDNDIIVPNITYYSNIDFDDRSNKKGYERFISSLSNIHASLEKNLHFTNQFFEQINNKKSIQNWVDIEAEYYLALNECLNRARRGGVEELNKEFSILQKALEEYLTSQNGIDVSPIIGGKINSIVKESVINKSITPDDSILLLNFNYTNTCNLYKDMFSNSKVEIKDINIHGGLNNPDNPIIFGYGDEIDDNYKLIEKENDNRYLENVKSIRYLETDNYKRLLAFISSDKYKIFIMGHSCGISDRTLLNTLFEHKNCSSIKMFYHKKKDGTDNYGDVVRNISRNFTDKALMRERVVNKKDSEPLS